MARYSRQYISQLLNQRDYSALVDLQSVAMGWDGFILSHSSFGWPRPIFVVFELLTWIAQANHSSVWTYYEATSVARLECVVTTLEALNATELLQHYVYGKNNWRDIEAVAQLDSWICENEPTIIEWSFAVLNDHPAELELVSS